LKIWSQQKLFLHATLCVHRVDSCMW
jgi:hypothetical protein